MSECTFCGAQLDETAGKLFVRANGERFYFCSGKCEKNWRKDRELAYAE